MILPICSEAGQKKDEIEFLKKTHDLNKINESDWK